MALMCTYIHVFYANRKQEFLKQDINLILQKGELLPQVAVQMRNILLDRFKLNEYLSAL